MVQYNEYGLEPLTEKLTKYAASVLRYYEKILNPEIFKKHIDKAHSRLKYLFQNTPEYLTDFNEGDKSLEFGPQLDLHTTEYLSPSFNEFGLGNAFVPEMILNENISIPRLNPNENYRLNEINHLWDYKQTVRYGIGAVMISNNYEKFISAENLKKNTKAKIAFKCQLGILDDIIDRGDYEYSEAREVFALVVDNMFSLDYDYRKFQRDLYSVLIEEQFKLIPVMTQNCSIFNGYYSKSNNRDKYMPYMEDLNKRVLAGQPLTIYQKKDYFDLKKMRKVSMGFYAPDSDLLWQDKLSAYVSGGTRYNLIDLSFADKNYELENFDDFYKGWYYFDIIIVYLNNIVNVDGDYKDGIYNLSIIDMKDIVEKFPSREDINVSDEEYINHLNRNIEFFRRGLKNVLKGFDDAERYYQFITFMMPIVMMAEWIDKKDHLLIHYIKEMARNYPA